ncbi:MAG TPA: hypothetical protein VKB23_10430 [Solirubrobacterales bacterium]|nr:hypothetical protein [Solirubrobacterales bacterium]
MGVVPAQAAFGLHGFDVGFENEDGTPAGKAGSHPFAMKTTFHVNNHEEKPGEFVLDEEVKNLEFELPVGFAGNPTAVPTCPRAQFLTFDSGGFPSCPDNTAVGEADLEIINPGSGGFAPVFNLEPPPGAAAALGFVVTQEPVTIDIGVRKDAPYNVSVATINTPQVVEFFGATVRVWGNPASPVHDGERGKCLFFGGSCPVGPGVPEKPFLTLPRACAPPLFSSYSALSWQHPDAAPVTGSSETSLDLSECEQLEFAPTIKAKPTTLAAESPSGLDFDLDIDDQGLSEPEGTADSDIKKAVVTLPEGITTNPSVASGLGACTLAEYRSETVNSDPGSGCPESAKVGAVEVETPLLEDKILRGSIYVAKQGDNPFGNLLTIYMVIKDPELGILVRAAGKVDPDQASGQLTTTFDDLPQLPFSHFHLHFREGQRAPLITPATCGTYTTTAELYPYSAPSTPRHESASFTIGSGAGGGPCAGDLSQLPGGVSFSAGTVDPTAGADSPFLFRVSRADGTRHLASISATLPDGLTGRLAGIPYCSEAQIAQAQSRSGEGQGALELSQPSCPLASELGTVTVGAGAGSQPYHVQGKAYLAGPYNGAPLSMVIVTPAIAGPFDLGVVAVRTALRVDSETARITAVSDPIPQILHGLPLVVRSVALDLDRPGFMRNPTGCEPKSIEATATAALGAATALSQYFQAADCARLEYKPKLTLRLKGGSKRSDNPALRATASFPQGAFANTARVQVALPHSEFLDQSHIRTICTRVQFAADACPKGSIYGKAKAVSPLLDEPLQGPVYLRSSDNPLPDLVAALDGQIDFDLVGRIDSVRGGIRTTFAAAPDVPVESFTLSMQGGRKGLLENSTDICRRRNRAIASFLAHNGLRYNARPALRADCRRRGPRGGR